MSRDAALEAEIQAKGLNAPRVRPQEIADAIVSEHGFTVGAALRAIGHPTAPEYAINKIWPLLGFRLRDKLHAVETAQVPDRDQAHPLHANVVVDRSLD